MKTISLIFFSLIILSSSVFALIYVLWKDIVEANPAFFTISLIITLVIGMGGMMYSMISNPPAVERQKLN